MFYVAVFLLTNLILVLSFEVAYFWFVFTPSRSFTSRSFVSGSFTLNHNVRFPFPPSPMYWAVYLMSHINRRVTFLSLKIFISVIIFSPIFFFLSRTLISYMSAFFGQSACFSFLFPYYYLFVLVSGGCLAAFKNLSSHVLNFKKYFLVHWLPLSEHPVLVSWV